MNPVVGVIEDEDVVEVGQAIATLSD